MSTSGFVCRCWWLLVGAIYMARAEPWNLTTYELCQHVTLNGIPAESSGITYSPVTNSLWVITRRPQAVMEYTVSGSKLREYPFKDLSDPEGITWMYDYTFAVAQEGGGTAAISILDLLPWRDSSVLRRKLVLTDVKCKNNFCFEGITYDVNRNVFYALQEKEPMVVWEVSVSGYAKPLIRVEDLRWPGFRDLAGAYFRAGATLATNIFLLSQDEQNVVKADFNGTILANKRVEDNMVEGLTFTPDGAIMFTVGEPNDLWIYSSTGECDWKPKPGYKLPKLPTKVQHERLAQLTAPVGKDPNGGYCNWRNCNRKAQGLPYCNKNVDQCVGDCGGTWCWWDGVGKEISRDNYEKPTPEPTLASPPPPPFPPPPPPPPRKGYCNYSNCNNKRRGKQECHKSPQACSANNCGKNWCWEDGIGNPPAPIRRPSPPPPKAKIPPPPPPPPKIRVPPPPPPPMEAMEPTPTPLPSLDLDAIPDNIHLEMLDDESFRTEGYEAVMKLVLENLSVADFTDLQQLYFRQAIALEAYGSPNGFMQVVFNTTTVEARNDWAMFKDFLNPETLERLVATNGQALEGIDADDALVVDLHLLGATKYQAMILANRTEEAIVSGQLKESLVLIGFQHDIDVSVFNVSIVKSEVSPEFFPHSVIEDVIRRDSYEVVDIMVATSELGGPAPSSSSSTTAIIVGVCVAAGAVAAAVAAAILCRQSQASETPDDDPKSAPGESKAEKTEEIPPSVSVTPIKAAGHQGDAEVDELPTHV